MLSSFALDMLRALSACATDGIDVALALPISFLVGVGDEYFYLLCW